MTLTKKQERAKIAYDQVKTDIVGSSVLKEKEDYAQIAKKFPALVHSCGLAQAVAFIEAKEGEVGKKYLTHVCAVLNEHQDIGDVSRNAELMEYQRFSRDVIESATWIKRYTEALLGEE